MTLNKMTSLAWRVVVGMGLLGGVVHSGYAVVPATTNQNGNVTRDTLKNGLRVVIVRDTLAPMVTTQITYLAGGYETPKGYPGTAHALEHMMFRDSTGMTGAQLNEMTGKMGGDNNAFTTNDATQYFFVAPSAYLDVLLHIEATRMKGLLLGNKDWELEKGAIEQEVSRDISDPGFLAFEKAEGLLYAGTGYQADPLGTRPTFDHTTSSVLKQFYTDWYVPNNAVFVIVGDVDPKATLAKVKQLFDPIPKRATPVRVPIKLAPFKPQTIASSTPEGTGSVQFMYRMPGMQTKDYAATQILMDVLSNARSSLSELAAQGKVLDADAQLQPFTRGGIGIVEASFPKGGDAKQTRVSLDAVIAQVIKEGVSPELVDAAKRSELAQAEFNKNSAVNLASAWSQALAWQGVNSPEAAEKLISAVTVDDVNRVARKYLKSHERITVVLTPDENGKRPPDSSGFGGTESFGSDDKLDVPLPSWAKKALGTLSMPHWTLAPTAMTLSNGLRLIVQPESISRTVTVVGHIDHDAGLQEPAGQEGVGQLLASLFDYGTTHLDRSAFHKALDDISATASGGSDFMLAVPSGAFNRGVQLLADNELHPALPEQAFEVQRATLARTLAGEIESPQYKMFRALKIGMLPAGDPALRRALPATVDALNLSDVKSYFDATYRPDLTTLVVVGNVTPQQAKVTVEKYFGNWRAKGPKPEVILPPVPLHPASYALVNNAFASQDQILMGQMLDLNLTNPDRYAMKLGNDVLGGNGFASRLMVDVRVKHGYAYGASSGMRFERSRSMFYIQYGSDPGKVAPVDGLIRRNLAEMQNTPIKQDELLSARQFEIRSIPLGVASVDQIARSLVNWGNQGLPLNEPMVAAKHYLNLTAPQVQAAFKKYLQPAHMVQVVEGPAPVNH